MNTPPVNIALAGIGGFGESYLDALLPRQQTPLGGVPYRIVGCVDPLPHRCRKLHELRARGIHVHPSIQSLYAAADGAIDLMMIATPIHVHAPHTCFALQHNSNVLCEKPLAGTLHDAVRMLQTQVSHAGFAAIGYQWSFSQAVQALKADVMSGTLGKPIRLRSIAFFPRPRAYFRRNDWAGRIRMTSGEGVLDSPVNNATSHFLHNMFYLLGATRETSAMPAKVQAELYRANEIENYDTAAVRCRTEGGVEVLFYTTHAAPDRIGPRSRFEFEHATVDFDTASGGHFVAKFKDGRIKDYGQPNLDRAEKIFHCIDAVRSGKPVACGVQAAMAHTLCVMAAQESAPAIIDFPNSLKHLVPLDGDAIVCVRGLPEALNACYDAGVLPAEHGTKFDWTRPSNGVDLELPEWTRRRKTHPAPAAATTAALPA